MTYYKVLRADGTAWYDGETRWTRKGISVPGAAPGESCGHGLHLAKSINAAFLMNAKFPCQVWEAEPMPGEKILGEDRFKIRVARARLVHRLRLPWIEGVNQLLREIKSIRWFARNKPPRKRWRMFETWAAARAAAGDAGWTTALIATSLSAGDAAWDAAWDAAEDAARDAACTAARSAARAATGRAARAGTRDVAWAAARDAASDVALLAAIRVCNGLFLDRKFILHAQRRWEVWTRGYGLLCDVDGELYVYERP